MSLTNPFQENHIEESKPSSLLNTAAILSIIGSVVALINSLTSYFNAEKNYERISKMLNSEEIKQAPSFVKSIFNENSLMMAQKMIENKLPLLIIGIIGSFLCFFGAIFMRKLKKDGYFLWLTGELLHVLSNIIFIGTAVYAGISLLNLLFPLAFIVIYTLCKKELVN